MTTVRNNPVANVPDRDRNTVAAYFRNPDDAEKAISDLSSAGFPKKDIGVALWDSNIKAGKTQTAPAREGGAVERFRSMFAPGERSEYTSQQGMDVLEGMGIPDEHRRYYNNALRSGGVLVTVNTGGRSAEAYSILRRHKGMTSDMSASDIERNDMGARDRSLDVQNTGEQHIQLLGEVLRVYKERVQRGSVTVRKEVVTERQNIEVPVTREEVVIERHAAEGTEPATAGFQDQKEIRVPLSEERVKVEKRPVVREDVVVGKRTVKDTETVSDDVRHEEMKVEKEGDVSDVTRERKRAS